MGYFIDSLRALATTMRTAFRKPTTVEYPKIERPRGERFRQSFALLHDEHGEEKCIGCLMCERICPSHVITVKQGPKRESKVTGKKRGVAEDFTLDLTACIYCELCVQVCPEDAIVMTKTPEVPTFAREDLVLTMDALYANETKRPLSWGRGSLLMAMQEPADAKGGKPAAAKPAAAKPAAAKPAEAKPAAVAQPVEPASAVKTEGSGPSRVATEVKTEGSGPSRVASDVRPAPEKAVEPSSEGIAARSREEGIS